MSAWILVSPMYWSRSQYGQSEYVSWAFMRAVRVPVSQILAITGSLASNSARTPERVAGKERPHRLECQGLVPGLDVHLDEAPRAPREGRPGAAAPPVANVRVAEAEDRAIRRLVAVALGALCVDEGLGVGDPQGRPLSPPVASSG